MMLKIIYLIDKLKEAGAQKHLLGVISNLDKERFKPKLLTLEELGVKRIYGLSGIRGLIRLIRIIRQENPDIVHTYLFSENILGVFAAKLAGVKFIVTSRRDTGILREGKLRHILAYRLTNRWVDKIICVSEAVKKVVLAKEKINPDKVTVIYNGVDIEKFNPALYQKCGAKFKIKSSLGIEEDESVVGMIANFSWIKGHKEFIEAAKLVLKEMPNTKFLLVGDGPLLENQKSKIKNQRLEDKILFLGRRQDIPELLSVMDVSVNASYSEGMSNTILESMACGIPVVVTAVDGNLETVVNGVTGILVPPKNFKAMAEAIIKILKDRELAKRLGNNAKELVNNKFTSQMMVKEIEKLYSQLLAPKVAFIFSQFPCYDEVFILREMDALKKQRLNFLIFSLKTPKDKIIHKEAKDLTSDTIYVPFISLKIIFNQIYFLIIHPIRYLNAFLHIIKINLKSADFLLKSLAIFPKSVYMAGIFKRLKIRHIHAQWATHPTTSAIIISRLVNIPFSFTGHAHDIYLNTTGLKEKIRQADFVTTCTAYNKDYLLRLVDGHIKKDKIIVNYHSVDLEEFNSNTNRLWTEDHRPFYILSVGSLLECKGFDILIDACRILRDEKINFKCTIAGGGHLENNLKSKVRSLNLEDYIQFTGYITQDKLIPLYQNADVFVLPARLDIHWGIPNVLLEAMAASLPVVVTNLPSIKELIQEGENGFIIPEKDPKILAKILIRLYEDKDLRLKIRKDTPKVIEEKFNLKKNANRLIEIFKDAINA